MHALDDRPALHQHTPNWLAAWALIIAAMLALSEHRAFAAERRDWPACRGDNARGSFLPADIPTDLELLWRHSPRQAPQPAWPPPARGSYWQKLTKISPRVVDDHTFHPILSGDVVLFASSADDTVYCLDNSSGRVRWKFTTDGPVRYAPCVADDSVYFGSDDGHVYCIDLRSGELAWKRRLAPEDRRIPGNRRLISAWPVRTGLAVADDIVYVGAGLYPSQGVQVAALAAKNGEIVWQQSIDHTAHGYLLISQDRLVVPTGRSTPIVLRLTDGHFLGQLPGSPGTYAVISNREVVSGRGNDATMSAAEIGAKESLVSMPAEHVCVSPAQSYFAGHGRLQAIDLSRFMELTRQLATQEARYDELKKAAKKARARAEDDAATSDELADEAERIEAAIHAAEAKLQQVATSIKQIRADRKQCKRWEWPLSGVGCLAAANNAVVIGTKGAIELRSTRSGESLGKFPIKGFATGIALSNRHLVVTTEQGDIYCFGSKFSAGTNQQPAPSASSAANDRANAGDDWSNQVDALIEKSLEPTFGSAKGYAIVVGADNGPLIDALCEQTELTIAVVDDDPTVVERQRDALLEQGLYGSRCAVHLVKPGKLPFADYCANLVISSSGVAGAPEPRWAREELMRLARPAGGVAWLDNREPPRKRAALSGAGRWIHQYGNTENTAASSDRFTHWDLRLQWFGGPGPARMVDRHLRAPAPLVADGRMFVAGENSIVCVDSYNGTEYWRLDAPQSQRYSMPYDCGYSSVDGDRFALAVRDSAWIVNAATGTIEARIPIPQTQNTCATHWGHLSLRGDCLFGSIQKATASRTAPSRELIDLDYTNSRPLVTGMSLFRMSRETKIVDWRHDALVLNPTIAVSSERIYFVAATDQRLRDHPTGRIVLDRLLEAGAEVVALDEKTGDVVWKQPLGSHMSVCNNILYLQSTADFVILSGSYTRDNDSWYRVAVLDAKTGETVWTAEHQKGEPGAFGHGEQVHHPVVLGDRLVCEPVIYELRTGRRIGPGGEEATWTLTRPAHSCGTMSGAGNCLFFRSGNPTVMDLGSESQGLDRFRSISPSRPGCWINIIPADGLVLIPEASAGCVCHYSLQTSMAFQPVVRNTASSPSEK